MSKQVMQKALEALTLARSQLDVLWVSHHANRTDAALASADAAIAELRAEIVKPVEPVAGVVLRDGWPTLTRFIQETDTRLFTTPPDTEAVRRDAARYRWLRDECRDSDIKEGIVWISQGVGLDAAIDAAITAKNAIDSAIAAQGGGE